ncbi:MAG: lasso peptide biosynthesis B2 protein [Gaiellales bacterium]|nr:MAG: lasso peptide biosynthesis B2 protein [Gaiellales bacterium]
MLRVALLLAILPRQIRKKSVPDLLESIDPGVADTAQDRDRMVKTVGFADSLLKYRMFQRYGKCFLRSLALFRLLRQQGWPVGIRFGVKFVGPEEERQEPAEPHDGITGHSWLVLDGKPFLEDEQQREAYTTTYRYP